VHAINVIHSFSHPLEKLLRSQFGRQPAHNTWRIPARLWRKGLGASVEGFRFSTTEM